MEMTKEQVALMVQGCLAAKEEARKRPIVGKREYIERENDNSIEVLTYKGESNDKLPVFVQVHGGGWIGMDAVDDDTYCYRISKEMPAYVVNVNYKMLYEEPFPYQQNETVDIVKWLIENAESLNIDKDRIVISGGSAGGHIVAGAAILLQEQGIKVAGQILEVPFLDFSVSQEGDLLDQLHKHFFPNSLMTDRVVSPMVAPDMVLSKVAPCTVIVCGNDPLHPQGEQYAEKLTNLGVDVTLKMYKDGTHGFNTEPTIPLPEVEKQLKLREECFKFKMEMFRRYV